MHYARFKVLRAVNIKLWDTVRFDRSNILQKPVLSIFRVVKPCSFVGTNMMEATTASIIRACDNLKE